MNKELQDICDKKTAHKECHRLMIKYKKLKIKRKRDGEGGEPMGEGGRSYAQIHYDPDNLDDAVVTEVREEPEPPEIEVSETEEPEVPEEKPEEEETEEITREPLELFTEEQVETGESPSGAEWEPETFAEESEAEEPKVEKPIAEKPKTEELEEKNPSFSFDEIEALLKQQASAFDDISNTLRRLEKKFADEILNGENRDSAVKTMYKEMNDYKAGIVEKALKNVLYDMIDLRETMLAQIKFLREKKGQDSISLEEFESYADDLGDILEKHDVSIYKGETGKENVAVRQKITRKVETEDESLVRTVAESLSYGYEYGDKILYPERISIYIKKK